MVKRVRGGSGGGVVQALLYSRVSSDEQAREGLSLPAQLQACRRYAADKGWAIAAEYQDVLSGKRDDRPGYQELMAKARRLASDGRDVAVIVMRLDRLGRRVAERVRSREELKGIGVTTHSVREGGEVSDLVANILASVAEEEVTRLGERVRDTLQHTAANGWHVAGRPAWGYRLRPATPDERATGAPKSVLTIDETTAPYARQVFERVAAGETPRSVARWVAALPVEARGFAAGPARRPRLMEYTAIRRMLAAPLYVGQFEDGRRGRWEPIVDEQTWRVVQARLSASSGRSGPVSGVHLLARMIRCPECGGRMSGWTQAGRWRRYRCHSFAEGGERSVLDCKATAAAKPVDADVLAQVVALLEPLADGDAALRTAISRAWERLRKPDDATTRERARTLARARKDAADAKRRLADAARLLVDGTIDRTAYDALAAEEQQRLAVAEAALAAPDVATPAANLPPLEMVLAELDGWQAVLSGDVVPEQRRVLAVLIEQVVPVRLSHGKFRAEITWTPVARALGGDSLA